jgi:hypothetical protein
MAFSFAAKKSRLQEMNPLARIPKDAQPLGMTIFDFPQSVAWSWKVEEQRNKQDLAFPLFLVWFLNSDSIVEHRKSPDTDDPCHTSIRRSLDTVRECPDDFQCNFTSLASSNNAGSISSTAPPISVSPSVFCA